MGDGLQPEGDAQRRYRELVEALPLVTYIDEVGDRATNVYTSPQVVDLLGRSPEDWLTDPDFFAHILHPDDRDRVLGELAHSNATREPFQSEYRLLHADGHAVWVRDQSAIVEDASGRLFARGFLLDITETKRLEEQLLQARKMDAVGQFAGGIAHDFNNLLTVIAGYADLAARAPGAAEAAAALAGIRAAADEAASLTSRLLAFTRRDVPERTRVDLNTVVHASADLLRRLGGERVRLELSLADGLPPVAGDPSRLRQLIVNLGLNAHDAIDGDGTLTIETREAGDRVALRVSDTGRGMDAATKARAFEPFFTTKAEGEGTGLGLAVVYGVAEALGGSIAIESTPGEGTTVQVLLPAGIRAAEPDTAALADDGGPVAGAPRVLVVEDREVVRRLTRDALEEAGYRVTAAQNGVEALALVEEEPSFALLLTDVVMPEMSGPDLAQHLRARRPALRVLYMSGYTDDVLDADALAEAGTGFLRKPFGIGELTAKVRELLDTPAALTA